MPLKKGKSNFGSNVKEMINAGHKQDQAVAVAYKMAGEANKPGSKLKKAGMKGKKY